MLTVQWCFISYLKKKTNPFIFSHIQPMHSMNGIDEEYNYDKNRFMILFVSTNLEKYNQNLGNFEACYSETDITGWSKVTRKKWEYYIL